MSAGEVSENIQRGWNKTNAGRESEMVLEGGVSESRALAQQTLRP